MKKVEQTEMNMKYELPKTWEVDGFGGGFGDWESDGSSVCNCSGTINFGPDRKLGMVVYPVTSRSDMKKRENVWDCHFVATAKTSAYTSKKMTFTKSVSKWEQLGEVKENAEMMDDEVWSFNTTGPNYGFVIYFWGDKNVVNENEKIITKILDSFIQLKK